MDGIVESNRLRYHHRIELSSRAICIIFNKFLLSLLCLMASLGSTQHGLNILGLTSDSFGLLMIPLAIVSLLFVMVSFHNRDITGGMVLMIVSMLQLINTISSMAFGTPGLSWDQLFFIIAFAAAAYIYWKRGQVDRFPLYLMCLVMVASVLVPAYYEHISGIGYLTCGIMYFSSASRRLYRYCVKKERDEHLDIHIFDSKEEFERMLFGTAGLLSFSILSLFMCYYIIGGVEAITLYTVKIIISVITLMFGLYSINHKMIDEGVMLFCTSLNILVFSIAYLADFGTPIVLSVLTSLINLFLAFKFLQDRRTYILALVSMVLFVIFVMEFFFVYAKYMEAALLLLKIVTGIMAICSWIEYETGKPPVKFIVKIMDDFSLRPRVVSQTRDMTPLVTAGILLLWLGVNYILHNMNLHLDDDLFSFVGILLSILPLAYVSNLFMEFRVSEGMLIFTICSSTMVASISKLFYEGALTDFTYYSFFLVASICFLIFIKKRNIPMCCASLALLSSYLVNIITGNMYPLSSGILYVVSGLFLMYDTFLVVLFGDRFKGLLRNFYEVPNHNGVNSVVSTVPFVFYVLSLTCVLFTFEDSSSGFCVLNIFFGFIALVVSFNCMVRGDTYSFPFVLMIVVVSVTDSFSYIMGLDITYFAYAPIVLIGLILAPTYIKNGRCLLGVGCVICGSLMLIGTLIGEWMLFWVGFGIIGLISFIYAINMWLDCDLGWRPFKGFRFMDLYSIKGKDADMPDSE